MTQIRSLRSPLTHSGDTGNDLSLPLIAKPLIEGGNLSTKEQLLKSGTVAIIYSDMKGKEINDCTGVRIYPNVVLTASHCVKGLDSFPLGVRQSLNPLDKSTKLEKIKAIKFPGLQNYYYERMTPTGSLERDIALIILEEDSKNPYISIEPVEEKMVIGKIAQYGYGRNSHREDAGCQPLSVLETGEVLQLQNISDFLNNYPSFDVKNTRTSVRPGDSGGPLFNVNANGEYKLIGILSNASEGPLSELKDGRAGYLEAASFVEWIRSAIGNNSFNSQLKDLKHQHPERDQFFLSAANYKEQYKQVCAKLNSQFGSKWTLNSDGYCLPSDKEFCLKASDGTIGTLPVSWNAKKKKCE